MSFPAYDSFGKEIGRGFAVWRVYMALQPPTLDFVKPKDVKVISLANHLRMGRRHVSAAILWLIEHGYVVEHSRDAKRVRSLTLAYALEREQVA